MKETVKKQLLTYTTIILLAIATTFCYLLFIVNNKFAPAGIAGILTMIQYKTGFSLGYMTLLVNIPLCIAAYFLVNRDFAIKSFVFCMADGISYIFFERLDLSRIAYNANGTDTILPVLIAGTISGFIYGILFKANGSSGGVDIIAKIIDEKHPFFEFVWIIFFLNTIVAASSYFVYYDINGLGQKIYNFKPVALCILYSFMSSRVSNIMLKDGKSAIKFEIITRDAEKLAREITEKLHHGVTLVDAVGVYSNKKQKMLICIVTKRQLHDFRKIISSYEGTFAYDTPVNDVIGNFDRI